MSRTLHLLSLLALTATLACSESTPNPDDGPDPTNGTPTGTAVAPDDEAPFLVSSTPEDGAVGQYGDLVITLTFSEPMDPATVEPKLDTSELGAVQLQWSDDLSELSITPLADLAYAEGPADDAGVLALDYAIYLAEGAADQAGNPMSSESLSFSTLRSLSGSFSLVQEMTRSITPDTVLYDVMDPLVVGDNDADMGIRAAISFNLWWMPEGVVEVTRGVIATRQLKGDTWGTPWTDLGADVQLDHITYAELEDDVAVNAAFNADQTSLGAYSSFAVEDQVVVEFDVTDAVDDDVANRAARLDRSQFLLGFDQLTDLNGDHDRTVFSRDSMELQVTFLVP